MGYRASSRLNIAAEAGSIRSAKGLLFAEGTRWSGQALCTPYRRRPASAYIRAVGRRSSFTDLLTFFG
jgi:hypothetical protein